MLFDQGTLIKSTKLAAVVLFATLVTGCAGSSIGGGIKEKNKDTTGAYDGTWTVAVQKAPSLQYIGNWNVTCGELERTFTMEVTDATITFYNEGTPTEAYVAADGRFKMIQPLTSKAKASGTSDVSISNGDRQLILRGKLAPEESKGYITYGIAEFGYNGCTAKTKFSR